MRKQGFVHRMNPLRTAESTHPLSQVARGKEFQFISYYQGKCESSNPLSADLMTFKQRFKEIDNLQEYHEKLINSSYEPNKEEEEEKVTKFSKLDRSIAVHEIVCECLDCGFKETYYYDKIKAMKDFRKHMLKHGHRGRVAEKKVTIYEPK